MQGNSLSQDHQRVVALELQKLEEELKYNILIGIDSEGCVNAPHRNLWQPYIRQFANVCINEPVTPRTPFLLSLKWGNIEILVELTLFLRSLDSGLIICSQCQEDDEMILYFIYSWPAFLDLQRRYPGKAFFSE